MCFYNLGLDGYIRKYKLTTEQCQAIYNNNTYDAIKAKLAKTRLSDPIDHRNNIYPLESRIAMAKYIDAKLKFVSGVGETQ